MALGIRACAERLLTLPQPQRNAATWPKTFPGRPPSHSLRGMCLRTCALLLALMAQQACVNGVVDGEIGGLVFNLRSIALRTIPQQFAVNNPNGLLPQVSLYQSVAVLSDQPDVCSDMQQHILRKGAKQFQIAVGQVDEAGRSMSPVVDSTYKALDIATLAFADDALPLPIATIMDGYSEGLFFVLDDLCNSPLYRSTPAAVAR